MRLQEQHDMCRHVWADFHPFIDHSTLPAWDAFLCPSLYKSQTLPMAASLARYVAMFYLSSVVRYRPDLLDDRDFALDAWFSNRLPKESAIHLLLNAISGIEGRASVFGSSVGSARV